MCYCLKMMLDRSFYRIYTTIRFSTGYNENSFILLCKFLPDLKILVLAFALSAVENFCYHNY